MNQTERFSLKDLIVILLGITIPFVVKGIFEEIYLVPLIATGLILVALTWFVIKSPRIRLVAIGVILAVLAGLGFYSYSTGRPAFSLNFLNLPFDESGAYYVTDSMVRANGDLRPYPSFTLKPIELEIVPHYSGSERLGNVVLRVSGDSQSKDYPLWADFDKDAQSQTVSLPLTDVIALSGIKLNYSEADTSLGLDEKPYQSASLSFQVLQLSKPAEPFEEGKLLLVINSPWVQNTRVIYRDGAFEVDYSLKNLGAEAKFHCRTSIGRVVGMGEDGHDFWSGVELFKYGPDCTPFVLKKGEVYRTSFTLDYETLEKDFIRGRYVVQIYTFPERSDVEFTGNWTYDNSSDAWVIGSDSQVRTFVVCNDPGKSCEQSITLPVEQRDVKAMAFDSRDQAQNGYSYLVVSSRPVGNRIANAYHLDYSMDPGRSGWAGFALVFQAPVDLSAYDAVQFRLKLDAGAYPVWAQLSSVAGDQETDKRVLVGDGNYGARSADEQAVVIPLSAFTGIDLTSVNAVDFVIDEYMLPDAALHDLQVSDIEFIRQ